MVSGKIMRKATEIFILLFVSVHLLFFGFSGYSNIFLAKKITFCTITSLYFLCGVIAFIIFRFKEKRAVFSYIKANFSAVHLCVLFFLAVAVISGLLSDYFPYTFFGISRFEGIFTVAYYCFSFILVSLFPCRKKYLLWVFGSSVTLFCAISIIQIFGYNPFSLYPDGMNFYDAGRLYTTAFLSTIGNTNLTGAFICTALPFFAVLLIKAKSKLKFLLLIPVLMLLFIVAKMNVDSAIIAIAFIFFVSIPLVFSFSKKACIVYFSVLLVICILFLVFIYNYPPSGGFLSEISQILHGDVSDSFGSGRIRIWKNVLSEIPDSPIIGKGPDVMYREDFEPFSRYYPDLGKNMTTKIDVAHNEPLNILYHQGVLGLICYLGFIILTLRSFFKNRRCTLNLAFGCAFICYLVQSMFTFSMCLTAPYFWICAGMVVGMKREIE